MATLKKLSVKFVNRIVKDFQQKELLPLKVLFFVNSATLFVLDPYLTLHMRELGITVGEIAIMSAVLPIIAIVMPPLAGIVADKIGNIKVLLSVFSSLGGAVTLLLLLVPVGRITVTYPKEVLFTLGCQTLSSDSEEDTFIGLQMAEDYPCNRTGMSKNLPLSMTLHTCGYTCTSRGNLADAPEIFQESQSEEDEDELSINAILKARSYRLAAKDFTTDQTNMFHYNLSIAQVSRKQTKRESLCRRYLKNNENYKTAIRRISYCSYFLPARDIYTFQCSSKNTSIVGHFPNQITRSRSQRPRRYGVLKQGCQIAPKGNTTHGTCIKPDSIFHGSLSRKSKVASSRRYFKVETLQWNETEIEPTCEKQVLNPNMTGTVFLHHPDNETQIIHEIQMRNCRLTCLLTAQRNDVCNNLEKVVLFDPTLTFWVYLANRVSTVIVGCVSFAMFEGATIAVVREQNADYGLQRIYGSIGGMISAPLSGLLIDYVSEGKRYTDFRPAFYLYAVLKLIGGGIILTLNLEFKIGAKNVISQVLIVLKQVEVAAHMIASFILGTSWGYIENFLFWLLQDLGGSRYLMGITNTAKGFASLPVLAVSGPIINKFGHANVIFLGFLFYSIRLAGYSVIQNPWHSLYFDVLESVSTTLAFTAAVTYASQLSSSTTDSSVQGLLGGLYFGVGRGAGSLVGGFLMNEMDTRVTFRVFAVYILLMGVIYYAFNRLYIQKRRNGENSEKNSEEHNKPAISKENLDSNSNDRVNGGIDGKNGIGQSHQVGLSTEVGSHVNDAFDGD